MFNATAAHAAITQIITSNDSPISFASALVASAFIPSDPYVGAWENELIPTRIYRDSTGSAVGHRAIISS